MANDVEVKVQDRVLRPVADVFEAIVDPAKMSQYFISKGSGRMVPGARLDWEWSDVGASCSVEVRQVEPGKRVVFVWAAAGKRSEVTLLLEPDGVATKLTAIEAPFSLTSESVAAALQQTQGWTNFICCLRGYLEHGVNLRLGTRAA